MSALLDHASIAVPDLGAAAPFWDAVMGALGVACVWRAPAGIGYGEGNGPANDAHCLLAPRKRPGPVGGRWHSAFRAADRAAVRAFHAAGLAADGCDGPPGLRPAHHPACSEAFLLDSAGSRVEAVRTRPDSA